MDVDEGLPAAWKIDGRYSGFTEKHGSLLKVSLQLGNLIKVDG